jgi:hypothetical protein
MSIRKSNRSNVTNSSNITTIGYPEWLELTALQIMDDFTGSLDMNSSLGGRGGGVSCIGSDLVASAQLIQLHRFGRTFWQNSPLFLAHLKAIERTHLIDLPSGQFTEEKRESKKPELIRSKGMVQSPS